MRGVRVPIVLVLMLVGPLLRAGELGAESLRVDAELLARGPVRLAEGWRYRPGDDPRYAEAEHDDASWDALDPAMRGGGIPDDWTGVGWFHLHFDLAPELAGEPLALDLETHGATGLYLDGVLLADYGDFGMRASAAVPEVQPSAYHLTMTAGPHLLAVRYANPMAGQFGRVGWPAGFFLRLGTSGSVAAGEIERGGRNRGYTGLFCGVFLSFAVLHFLLFVFYPSLKENFYFSLLCLSAALLVFLLLYKREIADPRFMLISEPAMNVVGVLLGLFALRFVYGVFYERLPRGWRVIVVAAALLCVWTWFRPAATLEYVFLAMLASCLELIRVVAVALLRRRPGAAIIGWGVLALGLGFGAGLLSNLGIVRSSPLLQSILPFSSIIALLLSMSIYLSLTFARTQRDLRFQLAEVGRLSEEKLAQERRARKEELERELLAAEYERKAAELEEARELQLSMLPRRLPTVEGLEIAAHMQTATEVGGDYYDFDLSEDGTLTFAVGDATGHGLRAGTMVTAAKSLFHALAPGGVLVETLQRSGGVLKRMNMRRLAMALTLGRYRQGAMTLAAAGMPPIYIYRASAASLESVALPGMPLGTLVGFPYEEQTVELEEGDAVLFMSDGFPERLNVDDEELGYENAAEAFSRYANQPAERIVEALLEVGERWAGGRPPDDDVTFVVMKVSARSAAGAT